jgi:hypothetical protein
MPSQTKTTKPPVYQYVEFATGPPLEGWIRNPNTDELVDLTGATVTISIAWAMPHGSYYRSPRDQIVTRQPAVVDPDQINNKGKVAWTPGETEGVDALTPPGSFLYQWYVQWPSSGDYADQLWTIPNNTYDPLIIRARVGGRAYNPS